MSSLETRRIHLNINWLILKFSGPRNWHNGSVSRPRNWRILSVSGPRNWHYGREILYLCNFFSCLWVSLLSSLNAKQSAFQSFLSPWFVYFHMDHRFMMNNNAAFSNSSHSEISFVCCQCTQIMGHKVTFLSSLIFTICSLQFLAHTYRLLMLITAPYLRCLTLKFVAHMHRFIMVHKISFLSCLVFTHTNIGIICPYGQFFNG